MQSIGERLEEARKRLGISIREATEATKLRTDFISFFESDRFDFDLPEVYKRGFLKLYAQFLKLDPEQILTDYNAIQMTGKEVSSVGKTELRQTFGRLQLPTDTTTSSTDDVETAAAAPPPEERLVTEDASPPYEIQPSFSFIDKTLYWKMGLWVMGSVLSLLAVVVIVKSLRSPYPEPERITQAKTFPIDEGTFPEIADTTDTSTAAKEIALIGKGDVRVIVRKKENQEEIFNGAIEAGQRVPLSKQEPLKVIFTEGNALIVESDGAQFAPEHGGPGWISID